MPSVMQPAINFQGQFKTRPKTELIVIHHSDSGPMTTVEDIHRWHLARPNWLGIGYHYVIQGDGTIWRGRPEWAQGAHAYDSETRQANSNGIGICLCGDFMAYGPTQAQLDSLAWLIKDIQSRYNNSLRVVGHGDVCATACPGALFPMDKLLAMLVEQPADPLQEFIDLGLIMSRDHKLSDLATKEFVLIVGRNILLKGGKLNG